MDHQLHHNAWQASSDVIFVLELSSCVHAWRTLLASSIELELGATRRLPKGWQAPRSSMESCSKWFGGQCLRAAGLEKLGAFF